MYQTDFETIKFVISRAERSTAHGRASLSVALAARPFYDGSLLERIEERLGLDRALREIDDGVEIEVEAGDG